MTTALRTIFVNDDMIKLCVLTDETGTCIQSIDDIEGFDIIDEQSYPAHTDEDAAIADFLERI